AGQIEQRDLHRAIGSGEGCVDARAFQEEYAQCVGVGQDAPFQERRDSLPDRAVHTLAPRPRRVTHQAVVRLHTDEHGIALEQRALAAVKGEPDRFREGGGQQERPDAGDLHGTPNQDSTRPYKCGGSGRGLPQPPFGGITHICTSQSIGRGICRTSSRSSSPTFWCCRWAGTGNARRTAWECARFPWWPWPV